MKAPLGEPPPPLVLGLAICGRRLWQAFRVDLGQEEWANENSQRKAETSHKTVRRSPRGGKDRVHIVPRQAWEAPRTAKNELENDKNCYVLPRWPKIRTRSAKSVSILDHAKVVASV